VGQATLVKSDSLAIAAGATGAVEIELGIGTDEAARILGVFLNVGTSGALILNTWAEGSASVSFDPEDLTIQVTDDEHFALLEVFHFVITTGGAKISDSQFFDFSKMNLITTRNLALCVGATGSPAVGICRIYYEKFKPTTNELNMLIAQRR